MGNVSIKTSHLDINETSLKRCSSKTSTIQNAFCLLQRSLDSDVKYRNGINQEMENISYQLNKTANELYRLGVFVRDTKGNYENAEREIQLLLDQMTIIDEPHKTENKSTNGLRNPLVLKGLGWLTTKILSGSVNQIMSSIRHLADFFKNKGDSINNDNKIQLRYNDNNNATVKFEDFNGFILEPEIYSGDVKKEITGKDITNLKKSLEKILAQYKGFDVTLTNEQGYYDSNIDIHLDEAVYKFLHWYQEYHPGNYLIFTYEALPNDYKLKALLHWVEMVEDDYSISAFIANLLPEEYCENIPPVPMYDDRLGEITNENKYDSSAAYDYYVKYYYPYDALNEIHHRNCPEDVKRTHFMEWARLTYGSNKKEQKEEYGFGVFWGIAMAPLKTVMDTIEGIYTVIKDPGQLWIFATFMAKAAVSKQYREALQTMITQAIEEWQLTYNEAEPFEKGRMIGSLIGEVLCVAFEGGKSAADLVKFIKSGGFRKALKGIMQTAKYIDELVNASLDDLSRLIKSIKKSSNCFEVVTPDGLVLKMEFDDLPDDTIKVLDNLVEETSKLDNVLRNINLKKMTSKELADIIQSNPEVRKELLKKITSEFGTAIKSHPLRQEYENAVKGLSDLAKKLKADGLADEAIAKHLHQKRRDLGIKYKDLSPQLLKEYIYDVNIGRYNDPLGPTVEFLRGEGKTWSDIINSACRPNPDVDRLLNKFKEWMVRKCGQ